MPRRAPVYLPGIVRRRAEWIPPVARGTWKPLLATPGKYTGAQDASGIRAAFSLDTFFWPRKRKYPALGCGNPIKKRRDSDTKKLTLIYTP